MGATWTSWRTTATVIITLLHIQGEFFEDFLRWCDLCEFSLLLKRIILELTQFTLMTGLLSLTTTSVRAVEGQTLSFICAYPQEYQSSVKYFYHVDDVASNTQLIRTDKHNQWEKNGRFSLYDDTTGAFVNISVDRPLLEDSGTYWCGVDISFFPDHISVIQLNVVQGTVCHHSSESIKLTTYTWTRVMCISQWYIE